MHHSEPISVKCSDGKYFAAGSSKNNIRGSKGLAMSKGKPKHLKRAVNLTSAKSTFGRGAFIIHLYFPLI